MQITAASQGKEADDGASKPPASIQNFFLGAAVLVNTIGGHSIALCAACL